MRSLPAILLIALAVGGFTYFGQDRAGDMPQPGAFDRYFPNPELSVSMIADLVAAEKWDVLAAYYDLSGTEIDPDALQSGSFFIKSAAAEAETGIAAGNDHYLQPFTPGARFRAARPLGNDVVEVTVVADNVEKRFRLKAHPEGYQLIPLL